MAFDPWLQPILSRFTNGKEIQQIRGEHGSFHEVPSRFYAEPGTNTEQPFICNIKIGNADEPIS